MNQVVETPNVAQRRIQTALAEVFEANVDLRQSPRLSYFGPATISLESSDKGQLSAFARDVSDEGIGLVHLMPIDRGNVVITLTLPSGRRVKLKTEIIWCRGYDNGWYASGGRFIEVVG